jgi:hypothetical protein
MSCRGHPPSEGCFSISTDYSRTLGLLRKGTVLMLVISLNASLITFIINEGQSRAGLTYFGWQGIRVT